MQDRVHFTQEQPTRKRMLVTGASGFVGGALAKHLVDLGYEVIALGRRVELENEVAQILQDKKAEGADSVFCYKSVDLQDMSKLSQAVGTKPIECIFHLASIGKQSHNFKDYIDNNIVPMMNVITLSEQVGCKNIIFSSTFDALSLTDGGLYDERAPVAHDNYYGLSKYTCEQLLKLACDDMKDLFCAALRFPGLVGKGQNNGLAYTFSSILMQNRTLALHGGGGYMRTLLHINDVLDVLMRAYQYGRERSGYELFYTSASNAMSLYEIAYFLKSLLRSDSQIQVSHTESSNNFSARIDIAKARELLGFNPHSIEWALEQYLKT